MPLQEKHGALTNRLPGNSPEGLIYIYIFVFWGGVVTIEFYFIIYKYQGLKISLRSQGQRIK